MVMVRAAAATALAVGCFALAPAALADADPASDVLLTADVYFPYDSSVSPDVKTNLETAVARSKGRGYRVKVAVIEQKVDLGGVPSFYAHPKTYARFLALELAAVYKGRLLVVMPSGFGFYAGKKSTAKADRTLRKIHIQPGGEGLLKAAAAAVKKLSAAKA